MKENYDKINYKAVLRKMMKIHICAKNLNLIYIQGIENKIHFHSIYKAVRSSIKIVVMNSLI